MMKNHHWKLASRKAVNFWGNCDAVAVIGVRRSEECTLIAGQCL